MAWESQTVMVKGPWAPSAATVFNGFDIIVDPLRRLDLRLDLCFPYPLR